MTTCPYQVIYETRDKHLRYRECNQPATAGGYCATHQYVAELLALAEKLEYPAYTIAMLDGRPVYSIARGKLAWEGYANRHPASRHSEMVKRLKAELHKRLENAA